MISSRPWGGVQVVGVVTGNAVAIAAALVAWWAASGTGKATEQIGFSSLALVGAVIALASNAWFLARGRPMIRGAQGVVMSERRFAPFPGDTAPSLPNGSGRPRAGTVARPDGYPTVPGTS